MRQVKSELLIHRTSMTVTKRQRRDKGVVDNKQVEMSMFANRELGWIQVNDRSPDHDTLSTQPVAPFRAF